MKTIGQLESLRNADKMQVLHGFAMIFNVDQLSWICNDFQRGAALMVF
jgi:hypothetical protein